MTVFGLNHLMCEPGHTDESLSAPGAVHMNKTTDCIEISELVLLNTGPST